MAALEEIYAPIQDEALPLEEPLAYAIPEDRAAYFRMREISHRAADMAMHATVNYDPAERYGSLGYENLLQAIYFAERGEKEARLMIETNVRTHVIECLMKAGVIFSTELFSAGYGRFIQNGQYLEEVYEAALRFAAKGEDMQERTKQEIYNGFLGARWHHKGWLKDASILVFSPYPTDPQMTPERARKIGFFPETMSCAIQRLTVKGGRIFQEVAFVAGVDDHGERFDLAAIAALAKELGVSIDASSASSILATPIALSNKVNLVDIVKLYDKHASSPWQRRFFGQEAKSHDYESYVQECQQRIKDLEPLVQAISDELQSSISEMRTPPDATQILHDIAQRKIVIELATKRHDIDARVVGPEAAADIAIARQALQTGDWEAFDRAVDRAQATAMTGSCPIDELTGNKQSSQDTSDYLTEGFHEHCREVKNGDKGKCPTCSKLVSIIVIGDKLYCSNGRCDAAPRWLQNQARLEQQQMERKRQVATRAVSMFGLAVQAQKSRQQSIFAGLPAI